MEQESSPHLAEDGLEASLLIDLPQGDLDPTQYATIQQVEDTPTQDQAYLIQQWWSSLEGPPNTYDNYLTCLNQDLKDIVQEAGSCKSKLLPRYLKDTLQVKV